MFVALRRFYFVSWVARRIFNFKVKYSATRSALGIIFAFMTIIARLLGCAIRANYFVFVMTINFLVRIGYSRLKSFFFCGLIFCIMTSWALPAIFAAPCGDAFNSAVTASAAYVVFFALDVSHPVARLSVAFGATVNPIPLAIYQISVKMFFWRMYFYASIFFICEASVWLLFFFAK